MFNILIDTPNRDQRRVAQNGGIRPIRRDGTRDFHQSVRRSQSRARAPLSALDATRTELLLLQLASERARESRVLAAHLADLSSKRPPDGRRLTLRVAEVEEVVQEVI